MVESDDPDRFRPPSIFHTSLDRVPRLVLRRARPGTKGLIATFAGFTSAEAATRLVGAELLIRQEDRRRLASDEYWPDQLVGLAVRIGPDAVGVVENLVQGPQDRLVVACSDGAVVEVPFVEPLVPEIDLEGGWLRVDPPEGLFS